MHVALLASFYFFFPSLTGCVSLLRVLLRPEQQSFFFAPLQRVRALAAFVFFCFYSCVICILSHLRIPFVLLVSFRVQY